MKLKTVRVRRNRPSALSAALALMMTMLFVYLISLSAGSEEDASPAASTASADASIRMEALSVIFELEGRYDLPLEARVAAAKCVQAGGAGVILSDGAQYAVVRAVSASAEGENLLQRSADGLTLKISGSAGEISAIADAVDFLHAQATQTGGLAQTLEDGGADAATLETLFRLYRTQAEKALSALDDLPADSAVVLRLRCALRAALDRMTNLSQIDPAYIRRNQAAACAEWLSLLEDLAPGEAAAG